MWSHQFSCTATILQALYSVTFCSDCGYCNVYLVLLLLGFDATIFSTLKRMEWVPYTYGQKLKGQDKREKIPTKFGQSVFQAFACFSNYMLKVMAWRSDTGSVLLVMDSSQNDSNCQAFDVCFRDNSGTKWYKSKTIM